MSGEAPHSRLKITYLIGSLDLGGAEQQLVRLANHLDPAQFEARVVCLFSGGALVEQLLPSIPVEALSVHRLREAGPRGRYILGARLLMTLHRKLREHRPDVLHAYLPTSYVLAGLTGKAARIPVVIGSRRALVTYADYPQLRWRIAARLANRLIDVHLCNSEAVRRRAIEAEGLNPARTEVIQNGIDPPAGPSPPELPAEWRPGQDGEVAAMIANLIEYKGHVVLLEALKEVVPGHPDFKVVLFGEGPERARLEAQVAASGLAGNVVFAGLIPGAARYLPLFDFALLCSYHEGMPNAVMEAMAAGIPTVASAVGGVVELIQDGVHGRLVAPRDPVALAAAIRWMIENPADGARMGRSAAVRVDEMLSVDRMVSLTEDLYRRLSRRGVRRTLQGVA